MAHESLLRDLPGIVDDVLVADAICLEVFKQFLSRCRKEASRDRVKPAVDRELSSLGHIGSL